MPFDPKGNESLFSPYVGKWSNLTWNHQLDNHWFSGRFVSFRLGKMVSDMAVFGSYNFVSFTPWHSSPWHITIWVFIDKCNNTRSHPCIYRDHIHVLWGISSKSKFSGLRGDHWSQELLMETGRISPNSVYHSTISPQQFLMKFLSLLGFGEVGWVIFPKYVGKIKSYLLRFGLLGARFLGSSHTTHLGGTGSLGNLHPRKLTWLAGKNPHVQ